MLNKMKNNPKSTRNVAIVVVLALLLFGGMARAAYLQTFSQYQMVLNGDAEMELLQGSEFVDPGVTFYGETFFGGQKQVSAETQAQLEEELVITGLDTLDVSTCDDYNIRYQYEQQVLERLVRVLSDGQKPEGNTNTPGGTTNPSGEKDNSGDNSQQTDPSKPGSNTQEPGNTQNPGNTSKPVTEQDTNDNKPAYHLPDDVTYSNASLVYNGKDRTITVRNLPEDIIPIYSNNTHQVVGTYTATVKFVLADSIKDDYSAVKPASMTATLTIRQATPDYKVPTRLTATVGQTLKDVKLPEGFTFEEALTTSVGAEGVNVFKVTFTPADQHNYRTVTGIDVKIKVTNPNSGNTDNQKEAFLLPANVTFENATRTYNTHPQSIFVRNLPDGIIPEYSGNGQTDVGSYTVRVTFKLSDELKKTYSIVEPASMGATLTIDKAKPTYTVPTNLTAVEGSTLRSVKLPKGFSFQDGLNTSVGPVGTNTFKVTYTPSDTKNYETVTDIEVKIRVTAKSGGGDGGSDVEPTKPTLNLTGVTFAYNATGTPTYDPSKTYTASLNGVSGYEKYVTATITGDETAKDAGEHKAIVTFKLTAQGLRLYSGVSPSSLTATLTINQATPTGYKVPTGLTATENTTLSSVRLGDSHFKWKNPRQNVGAASNTPKEFTAIYTPSDPNYKAVEVTVKVKVNEKSGGGGGNPNPPVVKRTPVINGPATQTLKTGTDVNSILSQYEATVDGKKVDGTFSISKVGDKYVVTFTPDNTNLYNKADKDVTVTFKDPVVTPEKPTIKGKTEFTLNKGDDVNSILSSFKATDKNGKEIPGTFSVSKVGDKYVVTFTPTDTSKYETVDTNVTVTFKDPVVTPEKPTINSKTEFTLNKGDDINSILSGFKATDKTGKEIPGTFSVSKVGDKYVVTFTPTDTSKYETVDTNVTVTFKDPVVTPEKPTINGKTEFTLNKGDDINSILSGFKATDKTGKEIPGTFSVSKVGDKYVVTFTPTDTSKYETVDTNVTVTFKDPVTPPNPPVKVTPTINLPEGGLKVPSGIDVTNQDEVREWFASQVESGNVYVDFGNNKHGSQGLNIELNADGTYKITYTPTGDEAKDYNSTNTSVNLTTGQVGEGGGGSSGGGDNETDIDKKTNPSIGLPEGGLKVPSGVDVTNQDEVREWFASQVESGNVYVDFGNNKHGSQGLNIELNADGTYKITYTPTGDEAKDYNSTNTSVNLTTGQVGEGGGGSSGGGDNETDIDNDKKSNPSINLPEGGLRVPSGIDVTNQDEVREWFASQVESGNVYVDFGNNKHGSQGLDIELNADGTYKITYTPTGDEAKDYNSTDTSVNLTTGQVGEGGGGSSGEGDNETNVDTDKKTEPSISLPEGGLQIPVGIDVTNQDEVREWFASQVESGNVYVNFGDDKHGSQGLDIELNADGTYKITYTPTGDEANDYTGTDASGNFTTDQTDEGEKDTMNNGDGETKSDVSSAPNSILNIDANVTEQVITEDNAVTIPDVLETPAEEVTDNADAEIPKKEGEATEESDEEAEGDEQNPDEAEANLESEGGEVEPAADAA